MTESADAYPPLAGELTVRQFDAWCAERGVRPRIEWVSAWEVRLGDKVSRASDLQDAITAFMSAVDGGR